MADEQKVIATAGLISVAVGSANSIVKYQKPPSTRFLIGSGIAFMVFSAMGSTPALAEVAKGLAVGIMTTIVLGDGGGVLTYFAGKEETDTQKPTKRTPGHSSPSKDAPRVRVVPNPNGQFRTDSIPAQPYLP
jgi:hypothetical protein